jgi:hypothetical protein
LPFLFVIVGERLMRVGEAWVQCDGFLQEFRGQVGFARVFGGKGVLKYIACVLGLAVDEGFPDLGRGVVLFLETVNLGESARGVFVVGAELARFLVSGGGELQV